MTYIVLTRTLNLNSNKQKFHRDLALVSSLETSPQVSSLRTSPQVSSLQTSPHVSSPEVSSLRTSSRVSSMETSSQVRLEFGGNFDSGEFSGDSPQANIWRLRLT